MSGRGSLTDSQLFLLTFARILFPFVGENPKGKKEIWESEGAAAPPPTFTSKRKRRRKFGKLGRIQFQGRLSISSFFVWKVGGPRPKAGGRRPAFGFIRRGIGAAALGIKFATSDESLVFSDLLLSYFFIFKIKKKTRRRCGSSGRL